MSHVDSDDDEYSSDYDSDLSGISCDSPLSFSRPRPYASASVSASAAASAVAAAAHEEDDEDDGCPHVPQHYDDDDEVLYAESGRNTPVQYIPTRPSSSTVHKSHDASLSSRLPEAPSSFLSNKSSVTRLPPLPPPRYDAHDHAHVTPISSRPSTASARDGNHHSLLPLTSQQQSAAAAAAQHHSNINNNNHAPSHPSIAAILKQLLQKHDSASSSSSSNAHFSSPPPVPSVPPMSSGTLTPLSGSAHLKLAQLPSFIQDAFDELEHEQKHDNASHLTSSRPHTTSHPPPPLSFSPRLPLPSPPMSSRLSLASPLASASLSCIDLSSSARAPARSPAAVAWHSDLPGDDDDEGKADHSPDFDTASRASRARPKERRHDDRKLKFSPAKRRSHSHKRQHNDNIITSSLQQPKKLAEKKSMTTSGSVKDKERDRKEKEKDRDVDASPSNTAKKRKSKKSRKKRRLVSGSAILPQSNVSDAPIKCCCLVGNDVWTGERDGSIKIRAAQNGNVSERILTGEKLITCMCYVNTAVWAATDTGRILMIDSVDRSVLHVETACHSAICTMYWDGGEHVYVAGENWSCVSYTSGGALIRSYSGAAGAIRAITCVADTLWTGADDGVIRVYDVHSGAIMHEFKHTKGITSLLTLGNHVLSGSADGSIKVWKISSSHSNDSRPSTALSSRNEHQSPLTITCIQTVEAGFAISSLMAVGRTQIWSAGQSEKIVVWSQNQKEGTLKKYKELRDHSNSFTTGLLPVRHHDIYTLWSWSLGDEQLNSYQYEIINGKDVYQQIMQLKTNIHTLRANISRMKHHIHTLKTHDQDLNQQLSSERHAFQHELESLIYQLANTHHQFTQLQQEYKNLSTTCDTTQSQYASLQSEHNDLLSQHHDVKKQLSKLHADHDALQDKYDEHSTLWRKAHKEESTRRTALEDEMSTLQKQYSHAQHEKHDAENSMRQWRQRYEQLEDEHRQREREQHDSSLHQAKANQTIAALQLQLKQLQVERDTAVQREQESRERQCTLQRDYDELSSQMSSLDLNNLARDLKHVDHVMTRCKRHSHSVQQLLRNLPVNVSSRTQNELIDNHNSMLEQVQEAREKIKYILQHNLSDTLKLHVGIPVKDDNEYDKF